MSRPLNAELLKRFLTQAGERLDGEWLLVGGTLLAAVGVDIRPTIDIDLLGLGKKETAQVLELMELAESLGLSPESINQAAGIFLKKVGYARADLLILHKGSRATIYRPCLQLYWKLKIGRLSETDLKDCEHYLSACETAEDPIDYKNLRNLVQAAVDKELSLEKKARLTTLVQIVTGSR